jgi:hypothetical protein
MQVTFKVGDRVVLEQVDHYGFNGRDYHPFAGVDEGFTGIVVRVECEADEVYCYRVCRPEDGRVLDLMQHELQDG